MLLFLESFGNQEKIKVKILSLYDRRIIFSLPFDKMVELLLSPGFSSRYHWVCLGAAIKRASTLRTIFNRSVEALLIAAPKHTQW